MIGRSPFPDPAQGPRILFFSGGTALRGVSRLLVARTHRSVHLVTPFDSGGSSAALREALGMPAVGDLRNRMLALADLDAPGGREIHDLLAHRLPPAGAASALRSELGELTQQAGDLVRGCVQTCLDAVGRDFDLRRASVGNLVLAGAFLLQGRRLGEAVETFSELVGARGTVRPVSEDDLHLAVELDDGSVVVGQDRIMDPSACAARPRVKRLFVTRSREAPAPVRAAASPGVLDLIGSADLVCYPMGSFYTSVLASILPEGFATAIIRSAAPKVYVPNPGHDPEEQGMSLADKVRTLTGHLARGPLGSGGTRSMLQVIVVDDGVARGDEAALVPLANMGLRVVRARLRSTLDPLRFDDGAVVETLLALSPAGGDGQGQSDAPQGPTASGT